MANTTISGTATSFIQTITLEQSTNTKSAAIITGGQCLVKIQIAGTWDAASITFEESLDGSTYAAVKDDAGTTYTVTAGTDRVITIPLAKLIGASGYYKIVSTAAQSSSSPRTITVEHMLP